MRKKLFNIITFVSMMAIYLWLTSEEDPLFTYPELRHGITVKVVKAGTSLTFLHSEPRYILSISRKRSLYEHEVEISLFNFDEDMTAYLQRSSVTKDENGITFKQPSGHAVFIPQSAYEGGR
ncbi:hypothetical protein [Undibacterium squillarum]|uniref:hypothetical protein n=1 Tax=Undibacterium squillarum TaxID=1131567 RepID=UPI0035AE79EA